MLKSFKLNISDTLTSVIFPNKNHIDTYGFKSHNINFAKKMQISKNYASQKSDLQSDNYSHGSTRARQ